MANCGHNLRPSRGLAMVPADGISEVSSSYIRQKTMRDQADLLFHPGQEVRTERPHFRYFGYSSFFTLLLEKCNVTTAQPVEGRQGRSCVFGDTRRSQAGG